MRKRLVPVLVGPTAVGKTALAAALAACRPLTVISADSRQVYRRLNIGTAKPPRALRERLPHFGLDVVDPGERYSAGQFARDATRWLEELPADREPIVVGGTGFYVRALVDGLFREPPLDTMRRDRLRRWLSTIPSPAAWAVRLDRAFRSGGRQRASRAVEVALLTGRPLSWWQAHAKAEGTIRPWYVRLTLPRAVLHQRIAERVHAMLRDGLVEEVRSVLADGVAADAPGLDGVGYREVVAYLRGDLRAEALEEAIVVATRRYAKRQATWFRHQLDEAHVLTLDAGAAPEVLAEEVGRRWKLAAGEAR